MERVYVVLFKKKKIYIGFSWACGSLDKSYATIVTKEKSNTFF